LSSERLKGIWPLPGGWNSYVQTLKKILEKVDKENPTTTEMVSWLKDEYGLSGKTSPFGYLRVVKACLGFWKKLAVDLKSRRQSARFRIL